jgi:hypothetical protein
MFLYIHVLDYEMSEMPLRSKLSAKILFAASEGWKPSQNTYSVALAHVPIEVGLHSIDVSSKPVPQQPFLASKNPVITHIIIKINQSMSNEFVLLIEAH